MLFAVIDGPFDGVYFLPLIIWSSNQYKDSGSIFDRMSYTWNNIELRATMLWRAWYRIYECHRC